MNQLEHIQGIIGQNHIFTMINDGHQTSVVIMQKTGICCIRVSTEKIDGVPSEGAIIDMLNVMPQYPRLNYGTFILMKAEEIAKQVFNCKSVNLWVDSNAWMKAWYKRMGYETRKSTIDEDSRFEMMKKDLTMITKPN